MGPKPPHPPPDEPTPTTAVSPPNTVTNPSILPPNTPHNDSSPPSAPPPSRKRGRPRKNVNTITPTPKPVIASASHPLRRSERIRLQQNASTSCQECSIFPILISSSSQSSRAVSPESAKSINYYFPYYYNNWRFHDDPLSLMSPRAPSNDSDPSEIPELDPSETTTPHTIDQSGESEAPPPVEPSTARVQPPSPTLDDRLLLLDARLARMERNQHAFFAELGFNPPDPPLA